MIGLNRSTDLLHVFQVPVFRVAVDAPQRLDDALPGREDAIREQKRVKEVNAKESEIGQAVK